MALTANSLAMGSHRAARGIGSGKYPSPFVRFGFATVATTLTQGDALQRSGPHLIRAATTANGPLATSIVGILAPISPTRAALSINIGAFDTTPAAVRAKTTPAAGTPSYGSTVDDNFGFYYYPQMPGQVFASHMCVGANNLDGADFAADATGDAATDVGGYFDDVAFAITVIGAGAVNNEVDYPTLAGIGLLNAELTGVVGRIDTYAKTQYIEALTGSSVALVARPTPLVQGTSGTTRTLNPVTIWVPTGGLWF